MKLPARNHHITLPDAARMTRRHREARPDAERAGSFHADQVRELLEQPGVVALRYYHALEEDGRPAVILAGADVMNDDLVDGVLLELHFPCPPFCSLPNELNASERPTGKRPYRSVPLALPRRDHHIAVEAAAVMTRRYRDAFPEREKAGAFLATQVRGLLAHPDCVALRYYYALDAKGRDAMILVGVDPEGADLLDGVLLELHFPCPPFCSSPNALNASARTAATRRYEVAALAGAH